MAAAQSGFLTGLAKCGLEIENLIILSPDFVSF